MASDSGKKLYDYLRIKFKTEGMCSANCPDVPSIMWKDFKKQWIVLSVHSAPHLSYIAYCSTESEWLTNRPIPKLPLEKIHLKQNQRMRSHYLEMAFTHFTLIIEFNSSAKLQLWSDNLEMIRRRVYTELIKSPLHPEREDIYVMEITTDGIQFLTPTSEPRVVFEWKMSNIRRAQYHKHLGKIEIEVGRAAETGEGVFFFIGPNIKQFFLMLKTKIEELSKAASLLRRGDELPPRTPSETAMILINEYERANNTTIYPNKSTDNPPTTPTEHPTTRNSRQSTSSGGGLLPMMSTSLPPHSSLGLTAMSSDDSSSTGDDHNPMMVPHAPFLPPPPPNPPPPIVPNPPPPPNPPLPPKQGTPFDPPYQALNRETCERAPLYDHIDQYGVHSERHYTTSRSAKEYVHLQPRVMDTPLMNKMNLDEQPEYRSALRFN